MDALDTPRLDFFPIVAPANSPAVDSSAGPTPQGGFARALAQVPAASSTDDSSPAVAVVAAAPTAETLPTPTIEVDVAAAITEDWTSVIPWVNTALTPFIDSDSSVVAENPPEPLVPTVSLPTAIPVANPAPDHVPAPLVKAFIQACTTPISTCEAIADLTATESFSVSPVIESSFVMNTLPVTARLPKRQSSPTSPETSAADIPPSSDRVEEPAVAQPGETFLEVITPPSFVVYTLPTVPVEQPESISPGEQAGSEASFVTTIAPPTLEGVLHRVTHARSTLRPNADTKDVIAPTTPISPPQRDLSLPEQASSPLISTAQEVPSESASVEPTATSVSVPAPANSSVSLNGSRESASANASKSAPVNVAAPNPRIAASSPIDHIDDVVTVRTSAPATATTKILVVPAAPIENPTAPLPTPLPGPAVPPKSRSQRPRPSTDAAAEAIPAAVTPTALPTVIGNAARPLSDDTQPAAAVDHVTSPRWNREVPVAQMTAGETHSPSTSAAGQNPSDADTHAITQTAKITDESDVGPPVTIPIPVVAKGAARSGEHHALPAKLANAPSTLTASDFQPEPRESFAEEPLPRLDATSGTTRPEPVRVEAPSLDFGDPVPIHQSRQLVQRLGDAIGFARESGQHLSIRVAPPQFGPIVVEVRVHEGAMSARVETHSAIAHQMITDHLPQLHESLAARGATLDRIDVVPVENRAVSDRFLPDDRPLSEQESGGNAWVSTGTSGRQGAESQDTNRRRPPPVLPTPAVEAPVAVTPAVLGRPMELQALNVRV